MVQVEGLELVEEGLRVARGFDVLGDEWGDLGLAEGTDF